jgi:site-specific recombinase XerD
MPSGPAPIYLVRELDGYLRYCARDRGVRRTSNSDNWLQSKRRLLEWWDAQLNDESGNALDLRSVDRKLIYARLKTETGADVPSRPHKIAALKHFYSYLCDEEYGAGLMEPRDNPTLGVKVPQRQPQQITMDKVFTEEDFWRLLSALGPATGGRRPMSYAEGFDWRQDVMLLLASTGWHFSEARRFAKAGVFEPLPDGRGAEGDMALCVLHKNGSLHKTEVSGAVVEAARRIRAAGHLPEFSLFKTLRTLCEQLKIEPAIKPGRFRHFVATWAKNRGTAQGHIRDYHGHRSEHTTFAYNMRAVPAKVPTILDGWEGTANAAPTAPKTGTR